MIEKLPVIALGLEIFGFGLAILNTFHSEVSSSIDKFVRHVADRLGYNEIYFTTAAVDYDDSISPRDKDNIAFRRFFYFLLYWLNFWWVILFLDLSSYLIIEIFIAFVLAFILLVAIRILIILVFLNISLTLIDYFGKKNFVSGIGFLIGMLGLFLNTYQILISKYLWEGISIWAMAIIIAYIFIKEKG